MGMDWYERGQIMFLIDWDGLRWLGNIDVDWHGKEELAGYGYERD